MVGKTEQDYVTIIKDFFVKNGDWPRAQDIPNLSRGLQRRFGGLVAFREKHNLGDTNYTTGKYRSKIAKEINIRGNEKEKEVFDFLVEKFSRVNVHREFFFTDDKRCRADFCIFHKKGKVIVDCFYPKDVHSLRGCLNVKVRKYINSYPDFLDAPVIFLNLNKDISKETIDVLVSKKKTPLEKNQSVMNIDEFTKFIESVV